MSVEVRRTGEGLELELTGEWVAERFAALETGLASVDLAAAQQLSIGTRRLTALDLSGAWVLRRFVRRARAARAEEHTSELQSPYEIVCRLLPDTKHYDAD